MDLKAIDAPPTELEREAVDLVLGPAPEKEPPLSARVADERRTLLLPALHALQDACGWVSPGGLGYACRRLGVPPAEGYGVASFYSLFSLEPRPAVFAHVCDDVACAAAGAEQVCAGLSARKDWARSPCLGLCEQAPAALVTRARGRSEELGRVDAAKVKAALEGAPTTPLMPHLEALGPRKLLLRAGKIDPTSLDEYRAHRGYEALRRAVELGPEGVLREISDAKLVGRGGAAFPTGRKWEAVARAPVRPHYVVCNADESEPGTFKDRVLLEHDPFGLVEAMTIAGFATGAEQGFIYLRGEYPRAHQRLTNAIEVARRRGLLGAKILGRGFTFDLELRRGAGAYICGEETALFNSLEGYRGEPRNKPPFPVQAGLFGRPTAINNVETLVAVLDIVRDGAASYASVGTAGSPGTKLFCVSGKVVRPGVYEVPFGTKLRDLLAFAGGVVDGRKLRAILLGGAAGVFIGPDQLDVPLSFEHTRAAGLTLGSGVVLLLDETDALAPLLHRIAAFFRDESCGQCVPCRVGTVRQEELLARLAAKHPLGSVEQELALFKELAQSMRDASICGLGQTASSAIESALRLRPFEEQP
ncbi:MAG: NADH-ubiquinone oxidoreductase-F iron-sulfur binding region domain-containing protein [Myxococcota bacterium]